MMFIANIPYHRLRPVDAVVQPMHLSGSFFLAEIPKQVYIFLPNDMATFKSRASEPARHDFSYIEGGGQHVVIFLIPYFAIKGLNCSHLFPGHYLFRTTISRTNTIPTAFITGINFTVFPLPLYQQFSFKGQLSEPHSRGLEYGISYGRGNRWENRLTYSPGLKGVLGDMHFYYRYFRNGQNRVIVIICRLHTAVGKRTFS